MGFDIGSYSYGGEFDTYLFEFQVEIAADYEVFIYVDVDGDGIYSPCRTFNTLWHDYEVGLDGIYHISDEGPLIETANSSAVINYEDITEDGVYTASVILYYRLCAGYPPFRTSNPNPWTTVTSDLSVLVENIAPEISSTSLTETEAFTPYTLDISASDPNPTDTVQSITIHWGDGESETVNSDTATLSHVYESGGDYAIQIVASDGEDEGYETVFVEIEDTYTPPIGPATVTLGQDGYVTLSLPAGYFYEWSGATIVQPSGNSVRLQPIGQHHVTVKVIDSAGRFSHAAFVFQVPDGTPPGGSFQVSPFVGGEVDAAGAGDPDVEPIVTYFRMMYGEKGMTLLRAFRRAGHEVVVEDIYDWWMDSSLADTDQEPGGTKLTIQLDETLDPVTAAQYLMTELWEASGTYGVREQLMILLNKDPTNEVAWEAVKDSYLAAIQTGAGIATQLSNLYISGVTIISEPLDLVISLSDAVDGKYVAAAMGAIPFISSVWLKQGGKIIFKAADGRIIGEFLPRHLPFLKKVAEYEDLVMSNKWEKWETQIPNTPEWQQRRIRRFAKKHELIPNIPVTPITKHANFNSVAFEIPGATHAGHMVPLPPSYWKKGDTAQETYLNNTYLNGVQPEGYTWHHHHEGGLMQLVPKGVHKAYFHYGGRAEGHWGYPRKP